MPSPRRTNQLRFALSGEDAGTLLGALAWVLGALELMKDRGHAEADEEFHDLFDELGPALNRVVAQVSGGRAAIRPDDPVQAEIEEAFGKVRAAFERWIVLTAVDTAQAAMASRLATPQSEADPTSN
ncbi:MAG: hypothetical protein IT299_07985 [Dehalococcoidia bacterium]|nr:hypothetical protein [Dehalococcoidia bacterium]